MAIVTVYDLDGMSHEMESIDARECCSEMGWTLNDPSIDVAAQEEITVAKGKK